MHCACAEAAKQTMKKPAPRSIIARFMTKTTSFSIANHHSGYSCFAKVSSGARDNAVLVPTPLVERRQRFLDVERGGSAEVRQSGDKTSCFRAISVCIK